MSIDYRVISIGTLSAHPLWNESADVRTPHATTTLIDTGTERIVVDPGLPAVAMAARLSERSPVSRDRITHVFLTSLQPDHRRALDLFESARWLAHEPEVDAARSVLRARLAEAEAGGDRETAAIFRDDLERLTRLEAAPDRIATGVDLFPLPGVTPGTCGLLLSLPGLTVLVAGDAVATIEHLEQGKVLPTSLDVETARESFREAVEIADLIVPGRDNLTLNPLRRMM